MSNNLPNNFLINITNDDTYNSICTKTNESVYKKNICNLYTISLKKIYI